MMMADDKNDRFAALRAAGVKKQADEAAAKAAKADATRAALNALRGTAPKAPPAADTTRAALNALRDATPTAAPAEDATRAALDALRDATPKAAPTEDATRAALNALRDATPKAAPAEDTTRAALDALRDATPTAAPVTEDPLAGLADLSAQATPAPAPDDDPLAGLDDLLGEAGGAAPDDDPLAGLDDLPGEAPDDPLAGLDDLLGDPADPAGADEAASADPVGDLAAAPAESAESAEPDDLLADLDGLLDAPDAAPTSEPEGQAEAASLADDPLAGLDDLLADAPAAAPVSEPGEQAEAASLTDDPLAGLDDLLADAPAAAPAATPAETAPPQTPQTPFGRLDAPRPDRSGIHRPRFRMAILGDFTGRAAAGKVEVGDALASRRAIRLDVDTIDDVIAGFATTLRLAVTTQNGQESVIEVALREIDDLHPDELFEKLGLFGELAGLRGQLKNPATSAKAVARLKDWGLSDGSGLKTRRKSAGSEMPADRKLADFQALIGGAPSAASTAPTAPIEALIAGIIGPHVVAAPAPEAQALMAAVDDALSSAMRLVLHHPEFRALEAQWRSLDLLARRIETGDDIEIVLFDVSAEELAADLAADEDLTQAGLYRLLTDAGLPEDQGGGGAGGFSALFGLYTFEETPPHAEILARMARVAAHVDAPFFTALAPACLETPLRDRHALTDKAWRALRALPEAGYLGVVLPRFLLRHPYGQRTDPVDVFDFEEFSVQDGLRGLLWGNPVVAVAALLAATRTKVKRVEAMELGGVMSLDDMPFHFVTDAHGDQVALPCTERNLTVASLEGAVTRGLMALVSPRGRDQVRLASFQSLAGAQVLGPWAADVPAASIGAPKKAAAADPVASGLDLEMEIPAAAAESGAPAGAEEPDGLDALDDLDALLAGFEDAPAGEAAAGGDDDMDAELAALLEGL